MCVARENGYCVDLTGSNMNTNDLKWYLLRTHDGVPFDDFKKDDVNVNVNVNLNKRISNVWLGRENDVIRISARDCSVILGLSPFINRNELLLSKAHILKHKTIMTKDIQRGITLESVALKAFGDQIGLKICPGVCKDIRFPNFRLSGRPDGIVKENDCDIIVEVKCPKKNSRKCPVAHYIQIQIYLYLFGCDYGYYVEYISDKPLNILKISANTKFMSALWCHILSFVDEVDMMWKIKKLRY